MKITECMIDGLSCEIMYHNQRIRDNANDDVIVKSSRESARDLQGLLDELKKYVGKEVIIGIRGNS